MNNNTVYAGEKLSNDSWQIWKLLPCTYICAHHCFVLHMAELQACRNVYIGLVVQVAVVLHALYCAICSQHWIRHQSGVVHLCLTWSDFEWHRLWSYLNIITQWVILSVKKSRRRCMNMTRECGWIESGSLKFVCVSIKEIPRQKSESAWVRSIVSFDKLAIVLWGWWKAILREWYE